MRLFSELKRRNVLRMVVLYAVAAWLIMQVAEVVIALANLPDWIGPAILGLLAIGFPIALVLSWFYELTPEGISLEKDVAAAESVTHITGRRMDFIVIALMAAALIMFAYDKWSARGPIDQSIAVLPFENMSGDPGQEYFSDGISEELLNLLAQIKPLKVIARTSSFSFKGQNVDIATMAEKLNVRHVLEGSVRRSGDQVRITAQLIDAADSTHVWSQIYDRELDDIFAVQAEIATAISDALKVKLALVGGETVQPAVVKAASTDAYDAYLQGRELMQTRVRQNLEEAVRRCERSLRLDNKFAPAHAQMAFAIGLLNNSDEGHGYLTTAEVKRRAIPHLDRAQELEPDLAGAHAGRALLAGLAGDPKSQIEHARRALASNPSYSDAMTQLVSAFTKLGRYKESDAILKQMLVKDPLWFIGRFNYVQYLGETGRVDEAREVADQLIVENPRYGYWKHTEISYLYEGDIINTLSWGLHVPEENGYVMFTFVEFGEYDEARRFAVDMVPWIDLAEGRSDEVIAAVQAELESHPDNASAIYLAAYALYFAGRFEEMRPLIERKLESAPEGRPIPGDYSGIWTMRLALARRMAGDANGAQALAQIVRQDLAALRASGRQTWEIILTEAVVAAFEHNTDFAIARLKSAYEAGLISPDSFRDPIFEDLWDDPRFVALREEHNAFLAEEHEKVLQLICFNNPAPDNWQPLPETCDGVVEQTIF